MRKDFCLIVLVMLFNSSVLAEDAVIYSAQWGQDKKELDGWKVTNSGKALADPKAGPSMTFGTGGAVSPMISVKGNHRLRFKYKFVKTLPGMLYASAKQYSKGSQISFRELHKLSEPFPDPQSVELGITTETEADQIEFAFGLNGDAKQRMTVSSFEIIDQGPPAELAADPKELLEDPGWEARALRESLPPENSYGIGTWMGWGLPAVMTITNLPDRVHSGKQALMIRPKADTSQNFCGFRSQFSITTKLDAWYDFSIWAKGEGTVQLYYVNDSASNTILLSPTEWRQLHLLYSADNPCHKGFSVGVLVSGRVFIDDLSVKQISAAQAAELRKTANPWVVPGKVVQSIPDNEIRMPENLSLENANLRVVLSPVGGGHVVELEDKNQKVIWKDLSLLNLNFPGQPVTIDWNIPFKSVKSEDGKEIVFSHTVTGGDTAPFLDGVKIEQSFHLGADDRLLKVSWRLTNTSTGKRLPNPSVKNTWGAETSIRRLMAEGEEGSLVAEKKMVNTRNLVSGWMAGASDKASLVCGFDVRAVQEGILDPEKRNMSWSYLSLTLPPGGAWQTSSWIGSVALPEVNYADETVAAQVSLKKVEKQFELKLGISQFTPIASDVRCFVRDYGNKEIAVVDPKKSSSASFTPPSGRFITMLELTRGTETQVVELFNDPRAREQKDAGIQGAGTTQYCPTIPTRVLRLPDLGDLRATIAKSKKVLWAKGLFFQYYPLEALLKKSGFEVESVDWANGFPEDIEELTSYRAVVLSNLGAVHFSPLSRAVLSQYVRAGGQLLVTGGSLALGNALSTGTDFEDILPGKLGGAFDVQPCSSSQQLLAPGKDFPAEALPWKDKPRIYWMHTVKARPTAKILVTAGKDPVMLEWQFGLGKVILFSGTVEGDPKNGEMAAWDWKGWSGLWELVLKRLII